MYSIIDFLFYYSPVPSYNWTRKNGQLPHSARQENYNRVLVLPHVKVEDQGEYICRVSNDRSSDSKSLILNIQGKLILYHH